MWVISRFFKKLRRRRRLLPTLKSCGATRSMRRWLPEDVRRVVDPTAMRRWWILLQMVWIQAPVLMGAIPRPFPAVGMQLSLVPTLRGCWHLLLSNRQVCIRWFADKSAEQKANPMRGIVQTNLEVSYAYSRLHQYDRSG